MAPPVGRRRPRALFFASAAGTFALDQLAKAVVAARLDPDLPLPVVGHWLRLTLTHNTRSAFGLVSSTWVLVVVGGLVCAAIVSYVLCSGDRRQAAKQFVPLGLVFGGSMGNLVDRVRTGGVLDFIDLRVWPVFNVADVAITVGVVVLAISLIRRR
jgi:signal peptidase II